MDEQLPLCFYKDMGGGDGNLEVCLHGQWTPFRGKVKLWSFLAPVPPCQYKDRRGKTTISSCANTDDLHHLCPLLSLPTSVQNRYFQRQTGAKTERRHRGRCPDLSAQNAHPTKVGVILIALITTITCISKFDKSLINCTLQSCTLEAKGILASELQMLLTTMRKLWPSVEEEVQKRREKKKKQAWGMSKPKPFVFFTNI